MNTLEEYLSTLNESYSTSAVRRTRADKTKASAGSLALALARKNDDPLYRKMQMYRKMYKQAKNQILVKYRSKANSLARERASKYKH